MFTCIYVYASVHVHARALRVCSRVYARACRPTVSERRGFGAARVCISCFSRPTTLAPRVASRRLHHTVEHYITENDEPRVQSPGTLASLMCVMPLPRRECTAPATIPGTPEIEATLRSGLHALPARAIHRFSAIPRGQRNRTKTREIRVLQAAGSRLHFRWTVETEAGDRR